MWRPKTYIVYVVDENHRKNTIHVFAGRTCATGSRAPLGIEITWFSWFGCWNTDPSPASYVPLPRRCYLAAIWTPRHGMPKWMPTPSISHKTGGAPLTPTTPAPVLEGDTHVPASLLPDRLWYCLAPNARLSLLESRRPNPLGVA